MTQDELNHIKFLTNLELELRRAWALAVGNNVSDAACSIIRQAGKDITQQLQALVTENELVG